MDKTAVQRPARRRRQKKLYLNRSLGGNLAIVVMMTLVGLFMALPLVYSICSALKPLDELWMYPPRFFVENPTVKNFSDLFEMMSDSWVPFSRYLFNTLFVAVVGTAGHVIVASLCAYALAKHHFPGQNLIFRIIVLSLMFSTAVTQVPSFLIMNQAAYDQHLFRLDSSGFRLLPRAVFDEAVHWRPVFPTRCWNPPVLTAPANGAPFGALSCLWSSRHG